MILQNPSELVVDVGIEHTARDVRQTGTNVCLNREKDYMSMPRNTEAVVRAIKPYVLESGRTVKQEKFL